MKPLIRCVSALLVAGGLAQASSAWATTAYQLTDLGHLEPQSINNSGQVCGRIDGTYDAGLWAASTGLVDIGRPAGSSVGFANSINDRGQIAGEGASNTSFLWDPTAPNAITGTMYSLGDINPQGSERVPAMAINDSGLIVGHGFDFSGGGWRSFLWKPTVPNATTGSMVSLGGGGGKSVELTGINASGQIAATIDDGAYLWNPSSANSTSGDFYALETPAGTSSQAKKINRRGQICGAVSVGTDDHAFIWNPTIENGTSGAITDLGAFPGLTSTYANDINTAGEVVGRATPIAGGNGIGDHAFIWTSTAGLQDLNGLLVGDNPGWTLMDATGMNDNGWIVGWAVLDLDGTAGTDFAIRGFLLTPVPEPSLAVVGLGAFFVLGRALSSRQRRGNTASF